MRESEMLAPLLAWLAKLNRIGADSILAPEFPWMGRRVDLAMMAQRGSTSAFELKVSNNTRVVEQAAKNALSFDRSYVVTATRPASALLATAALEGIGVLFMEDGEIRRLVTPRPLRQSPHASKKLRQELRLKGGVVSVS